MKNYWLLLIVTFGILSLNAQSYQQNGYGIKTKTNSTEVEIQFFSPSLVRIVKYPEGKTFIKHSLSVVKTPEKVDFKVTRGMMR
jgi:alpha-D-xyloside xylohydrolase